MSQFHSEQVKNFYVGKDHVGDVPLSKKVLAGLTTGKGILSMLVWSICSSSEN